MVVTLLACGSAVATKESIYVCICTYTVTAVFFTGRYFHEFHEKLVFRENIIMNILNTS